MTFPQPADPVVEALDRLLADADPRVGQAAALAYSYGYAEGWGKGYARSFQDTPAAGVADQPTTEELDRIRGEVRMGDGTRRGLPRADDYPGGAADLSSWSGIAKEGPAGPKPSGWPPR